MPVCLSATHIAYGSIRMEPVFMILAQSSATAASLAMDQKVAVQAVNYAALREQLLKDGQVLVWSGTPSDGGNPPQATAAAEPLPGISLDDRDGATTGEWAPGSLVGERRIGTGYIHDSDTNKGACAIRWTPQIVESGEYEVILHFPPNPNRATNAPVTVEVAGAAARTVKVNEQEKTGRASLGTFSLKSGKSITITLSNKDTDGHVVADGVQLLRR